MDGVAYSPTICLAIVATLLILPFQSATASSGLVIEPPCHEGKLPFVLTFKATKTSNQSAGFEFAAYQNETRQPISAVSYIVNITDAVSDETLLSEVFHAENGTLALNVIHGQYNETTITDAYQEPFLNAWVANTSEPIVIHTPEMGLDRTYDVRVFILGAYDNRCLFPPDLVPKADFTWDPQEGNFANEVVVPEFRMIFLIILFTASIVAVTAYSRRK